MASSSKDIGIEKPKDIGIEHVKDIGIEQVKEVGIEKAKNNLLRRESSDFDLQSPQNRPFSTSPVSSVVDPLEYRQVESDSGEPEKIEEPKEPKEPKESKDKSEVSIENKKLKDQEIPISGAPTFSRSFSSRSLPTRTVLPGKRTQNERTQKDQKPVAVEVREAMRVTPFSTGRKMGYSLLPQFMHGLSALRSPKLNDSKPLDKLEVSSGSAFSKFEQKKKGQKRKAEVPPTVEYDSDEEYSDEDSLNTRRNKPPMESPKVPDSTAGLEFGQRDDLTPREDTPMPRSHSPKRARH